LKLKKNHGKEEERARDLFYGLWVPDIFMERVRDNADWTLFDPDQCHDLIDLYGHQFKERYEYYENDPYINKKIIKAHALFKSIMESQIETGTP